MSHRDQEHFDKQLDTIEQRYNRRGRKKDKTGVSSKGVFLNSSLSFALRAGTDMFSAVLVGGVIGWGLDYYFGSHGICLGVFIFLGGCAGVLNVIRLVMAREKQNERENSGR